MYIIRVVLFLLIIAGIVACDKIIPTVKNLGGEGGIASLEDPTPHINSGSGVMTGATTRIYSVVGPQSKVMVGTTYRIHMSGDN